jgi:hypothetical protein
MAKNEDIKRLFGNKQLRVQQEGRGKYSCTIYDVAGKILFITFERIFKSHVQITRRYDGTEEWRLIPPTALCADIPPVLREQFSHWLLATSSSDASVIEFRDISAKWSSDAVPMYTMNMKPQSMATVTRSRDQLVLLHFETALFFELHTKIFHRLELPEGTFVFINEDNAASPIAVELHRLGLDFEVDRASGKCTCRQLGMDVATNQDVGTLLTLQNQLVLERGDSKTRERIVIIPAGSGASHHSEDTTLVKLPPWGSSQAQVHQYIVDEDLKQLRCKSEHSLLYLAFLSAFTGDSIADPFTGITGLDMALLLLRHCKCNKPYDTESLCLLTMVISCTPQRGRYPEGWGPYERVKWPSHADPLARSDVLLLLPLLLVEEANQLSALHFKHTETIAANMKLLSDCRARLPLHTRAYYLAREYYPQSGLLNASEEERLRLQLLRPLSKEILSISRMPAPLSIIWQRTARSLRFA